MKKPRVARSGERLCRLAYDLESLASRLRAAGYDSEAEGVRSLSSRAGNIGRALERKLAGEPE